MAYWLVKSEPSSFSWSQQEAVGVEPWTGVRNAAARQNLAAMRAGERALFYHSTEGRECVGIVEIAREAYPDPTDATGRWLAVDMRAVAPLPRPVPLAALKADPSFADMPLVRLSRLSVSPVSDTHWQAILDLGGYAR